MNSITVLVEIEIFPDFIEHFTQEMERFAAIVLANEPCESFELLRDAHHPTRFCTLERWLDRDYFETQHAGTPHVQNLMSVGQSWLSAPPITRVFESQFK